ncbi:ABC transporter ATP-binding protein [Bordetella sp. 15P40C-2]|uniref:ABC transporter ATP-binding protein n=1 Tax=Bordetella sp. 15P40C-2 TaxID=2572246 RepID=UPI00132327B1|nr:ABC transporter ATP-binding protein [Bordetella sp. 15P40C-2]MVW71373.1 ATP-binding cassette domain-containing protein [Bordetella sp. 15P40C-2]
MAFIHMKSVSIDFPVYNVSGRSLKKRLLQVATGGQLGAGKDGNSVVVRALDNLNFRIDDGERVALLGHNGAGKSTMLRLLSGVYHPSSGVYEREGQIGSLIDISFGIDPEASGRENIYLRGALLGIDKAELESQVDAIIEFSQLGDFIDIPTRTYSSGMHLRLAFAVSTIIRPQILLMDEWLSVGDEGFKYSAEKRLTDLVESTNILVIASHSKELVSRVCTRGLWMEHGKVRMDGPIDEVVSAYFG